MYYFRNVKIFCLGIILCFSFSLSVKAKIKLPAFISDGMVLQQQSEAPIWGWASPGEKIIVKGSWDKAETYSTNANDFGKWRINVKTPTAGGPFKLMIKGSEKIILNDVMIGEVWLCSGQSNMEMPVEGWLPKYPLKDSKKEIANANYPEIRLFKVKKDIALTPQKDVEGAWSRTTPQTVGPFSAVAYFYGRELYKKLHVPVGLIESSWGGTVAEAWTSSNALRTMGDFNSALNKIEIMQPHLEDFEKKEQRDQKKWDDALEKVNHSYTKIEFNDSSWGKMKIPTRWETAGHPDLDGIVWFRKKIIVPNSFKDKNLRIDLGTIDDNDITWLNGHKIGSTNGYKKNRSYVVPADFVKAGANEISVRVVDPQGEGGIYGSSKRLRIYHPASSGSSSWDLTIAGDWKFKIAYKKTAAPILNKKNTPSVLFNGMIAPLIPYAIRGTIWYQGESNVGRADQYARLFPLMIKDWRSRWDRGKFPFYYVQIAPFPYWGDRTGQSEALRNVQRKTLSLPNTGMAVTMDIGDTTLIHPANKQAVGKRLALWALSQTYGKDNLVYSGPLYKNMHVEGSKAILSFSHVDGGLIAKGGHLHGFEIAGKDGKFIHAHAEIKDKKVIVYSNNVSHPKMVRYGWKATAQPYLFNKAGLPASTFKTSNKN